MVKHEYEHINIFDDEFGHFIKIKIEDSNIIISEVDKILYEEVGLLPGIVLLYNDVFVSTLTSKDAVYVADKVYKIDIEFNKSYNKVSSIRMYVRG